MKKSIIIFFFFLLLMINCGKRKTPLEPEYVTLNFPEPDEALSLNRPTFEWSEISYAYKYQIQIDDRNSFYTPVVDDSNITSTSYKCSISLSDREYWWRVRARQQYSIWEVWSQKRKFTIAAGIPVPVFPVDDTVNTDVPTFSWSEIPNSVKYRLQIDDYSSFYTPIVDDSTLTDEEFTISDTTLLDGEYYWRVRVKTGDGEWSDWSTVARFCVNTNPFRIVGQYQTMGYAKDVLVRDDTAYIAQGEGGLAIVDLTDEENPYLVGHCLAQGNASAIAIKDTFAYIAVGKNGVSTILFADPTLPVHQSLVGAGENNSADIVVYSPQDDTMSYIYVAEQDKGMWLLQISPQYPQQPQPYVSFDVPGYESGLFIDSTYLYIGCGELGLTIVDISRITVPEIVGNCDTDGYAKGLFVKDQFVYLTDGSRGIDIIDATDKSSPFIVSSFDTKDDAKSIFLKGDTAFIADENNGLVVLDVSDPSAPQYIGGVDTEYADAVWVENDYAVLADRYMGLVIVKWDRE